MAKKFYQLGANDDVALEEDVSAKYTKPETGIPKDDLSEDVKTSIGSANSAMQHSEFSALSGISDLVPDEVGLQQICSLMNTIKNLLKPTTACIAFLASILMINAADFQTAKYSSLVGKDEVVTNLSFAGLATESYVGTKISEATGDYQNVSNKAYSALQPTDVVNNVTSDATDKPLSANMGHELQDQINNLKQRGRYLSIWNCTNGLPTTSPTVSPYVYKAGDYYIVGFVSTATNYRPSGSSYTQGVPSTTVETQTVLVNDTYYFDGTVWTLLQAAQKEISFGSIAGSPYDNTNLSEALNSKQDTISDYTSSNAVQSIIQSNIDSNLLMSVEKATAMTNAAEGVDTDHRIVRGRIEPGAHGYSEGWDVLVGYAMLAEDIDGTLNWDKINHPTTLSGYGITNAYTKEESKEKFIENKNGRFVWVGEDQLSFNSGTLYVGVNVDAGSLTVEEGFSAIRDADYNSITSLTNGFITAQTATNITEAVVSEVMDYGLTNVTGTAITLVSGEIGNATITANTSVTLSFSADANKSGDCMIYAINATATDYTLSPQPTAQYTFVSADLAKALTIGKATTNVLSFTRLNSNTVLVGKLEVK